MPCSPTHFSEQGPGPPYLGVEHRIESIHIHIFAHQLQEEIWGCLEVGTGAGGPLGLPGQVGRDGGRHGAERRGNHQGRSSTVGSLLLRMGCGELGSPVSESALKECRNTQAGDPAQHMDITGHVRGRTSAMGPQHTGLGPGAEDEGMLRPSCSPHAVCPPPPTHTKGCAKGVPHEGAEASPLPSGPRWGTR